MADLNIVFTVLETIKQRLKIISLRCIHKHFPKCAWDELETISKSAYESHTHDGNNVNKGHYNITVSHPEKSNDFSVSSKSFPKLAWEELENGRVEESNKISAILLPL